MSTEERMREVLQKIRTADSIYQSDATDWESKYDVIFGMGIVDDLAGLGIRLDYCDPDTSYEEDVTAFVSALRETGDNIEKMLNGIVEYRESPAVACLRVGYYPKRDGRDYITPEDVQAAIDAGANRETLQHEVLEWLGKKAAEDWGLCAWVAANFKKSE